ncbi:MAG: DUF4080 domain-containing protein [Myxococcota bacterium]
MTTAPQGTADILLLALNATWEHASFGLRCLHAALDELASRADILEVTVNDRSADIVERVLQYDPTIVGLGVYVWNARESLEVVKLLKAVKPSLTVVLGGPEVSHETNYHEILARADYVVTGEGEDVFRELCQKILSPKRMAETVGRPALPSNLLPVLSAGEEKTAQVGGVTIIAGGQPDLSTVFQARSPYDLYTDDDLAKRVVYLEVSRGCPFRCEFCLSSLDERVRVFPLDAFLATLEKLLHRGLLRFKFVDRTFNLKLQDACQILDFFLERIRPGLFLHFEMIPDRLPEPLRTRLARFPPGCVQLEVGVQTLDEVVSARISRRQDVEKLEENIRWLRAHTGVHLHMDLIAGLPGEDLATFGRGFDQLFALGPQEIQLGILKRLRGAPIDRHTAAFGMKYSESPPYEVIETSAMSFLTLQRIKRLARYFDLVHNSGRFVATAGLLVTTSPFDQWLQFSDWLFQRAGATAGISLSRLSSYLLEYLVEQRGLDENTVRQHLEQDLGRSRVPGLPRRQGRHVGAADSNDAAATARAARPTHSPPQ